MGVYDLLESSDGLIGHGTGLVNVNGGQRKSFKFRMIVFRPFRGEIVLGKITSGSEKGIKISLEFFNDILVPPSLLLDGARFDYTDQVWVWDTEDGSTLYFDIGETVRFRVEAEEWHDQIPDAPTDLEGKTASERKPAYSIIVRTVCLIMLCGMCMFADIDDAIGIDADCGIRIGCLVVMVMTP
ncbi:DNA-directed RNA polymerase III subunit rpc25 [Ascosphaera atra]|nr:DNA-directed RNA polymerase III subunit rpc25 [Ascosphaera atra]